MRSLELRDLSEVKFNRCFTTEDVNKNFDLELVFVDLGDVARERCERTSLDLHCVVYFEFVRRSATLGGWLLNTFNNWANDVVNFTAS